jgi:hypothetical protein
MVASTRSGPTPASPEEEKTRAAHMLDPINRHSRMQTCRTVSRFITSSSRTGQRQSSKSVWSWPPSSRAKCYKKQAPGQVRRPLRRKKRKREQLTCLIPSTDIPARVGRMDRGRQLSGKDDDRRVGVLVLTMLQHLGGRNDARFAGRRENASSSHA